MLKSEENMPIVVYLVLLMLWSIISAAGLTLSLFYTNPLTLGPLGVTIWFVLLLLSAAGIVSLILYASKSFLHLHATRQQRLRYSWRQGLLISGWMTGMLSLSSLRQVGILDGILLALLLVIAEVYVRFRWP